MKKIFYNKKMKDYNNKWIIKSNSCKNQNKNKLIQKVK